MGRDVRASSAAQVRDNPSDGRCLQPSRSTEVERNAELDGALLTVGDEAELFTSWYARRWEPTVRHAASLLGDRADAEDVAAEVLAKVWERWRTAGEPEHPVAYVRRAVSNHVASRFRRRALERAVSCFGSDPVATESHERAVADGAEVSWLLEQLDTAERAALSAHYLEDRSCADIAAEAGIAVASVRSRLHRGRRRLAATAAGDLASSRRGVEARADGWART
jgi:RNA polymerase sigma-70 factor, ECF subfamily